jgi:hypothetical protein
MSDRLVYGTEESEYFVTKHQCKKELQGVDRIRCEDDIKGILNKQDVEMSWL